MSKIIIGVVVVVLIGVGAFYLTQNPAVVEDATIDKNGEAMEDEKSDDVMDDKSGEAMEDEKSDDVMKDEGGDTMMEDKEGEGAMMEKNEVKTFNLTGKKFKFSQEEIRVKKGDTVIINFESTDGFHDWVVDKFGAGTKQVNPGEPTSVEFVADQVGTFEFYCSVGNHRALGMVGNLIVE